MSFVYRLQWLLSLGIRWFLGGLLKLLVGMHQVNKNGLYSDAQEDLTILFLDIFLSNGGL